MNIGQFDQILEGIKDLVKIQVTYMQEAVKMGMSHEDALASSIALMQSVIVSTGRGEK